jgi:hypothetical protein
MISLFVLAGAGQWPTMFERIIALQGTLSTLFHATS